MRFRRYGIVGGFESPRSCLALCFFLSVPVVLGMVLSFLLQLPCPPAVMPSHQHGDGLYPSGTMSLNKSFLLYVALASVFVTAIGK